MATLIKISVAFTLFFLGNVSINAQSENANTIEGNGNVIKKIINTIPYDVIEVSGPIEVILEKGTEGSISISAEDNVLDKIIVESDGNKLSIGIQNNTSLRNTEKIKIIVPVEGINEISLRGSGNIESKDLLENNAISLNILGSGNIKVSIEATTIDAKLNGSGDMQLSGKSTNVEVKTTGSGNFNGKELISENAQIYISGSGDSSIFVNNTLKARIQGSGSVLYSGKPISNDVKVMGSGKVRSI